MIVGPTGVFVVETKSYSGPLSIRGDDVFVGGRRRTDIVHQARSEAEVVQAILAIAGGGLSVTPILCIHRAELPLLKAEVQGIRVVNERGLRAGPPADGPAPRAAGRPAGRRAAQQGTAPGGLGLSFFARGFVAAREPGAPPPLPVRSRLVPVVVLAVLVAIVAVLIWGSAELREPPPIGNPGPVGSPVVRPSVRPSVRRWAASPFGHAH